MKDYFEYVEYLSVNEIDEPFFNSGPFHAAIVMSRIFKSSKDIKIFSGGFTGEVSNNPMYLSELKNFLSKPTNKLSVIIEDYENNKNNKVYEIFKQFRNLNNNIEIYHTNVKISIYDNGDEGKAIHFTIGDENKIRIETNTSDFTAQANFNSQTSVSPFLKLFNDLLASQSTSPIKGFEPIPKQVDKVIN